MGISTGDAGSPDRRGIPGGQAVDGGSARCAGLPGRGGGEGQATALTDAVRLGRSAHRPGNFGAAREGERRKANCERGRFVV